MTPSQREWLRFAYQQARFMRPDAARYLRPDAARYMRPQVVERKFRVDQPRVPAGNPDGGQWTPIGFSTDISAQSRRPRAGTVRVRINGETLEATPGQAARYEVANARAREALDRVKALDPKWRPTPGFYNTNVESAIARANAEASEAKAHLRDLAAVGIGPGPFAGESIPARGTSRNFTEDERKEINRIGSETGCNTCGTRNPGTPQRKFYC